MKIINRKILNVRSNPISITFRYVNTIFISVIFAILILVTPSVLLAVDIKPGAEILEDFRIETSYRDMDENGAVIETDATYTILSVYPSLTLGFGNKMNAFMTADITWFASIDGEDENESDISFLYAYILRQDENLSIQAGLIPVEAGEGYLFSGNDPGVKLSTRISMRHYVMIQAAAIYGQSPFITAELEYRFRFLEDISLFGAWFIDKDDSVADLFDSIDSNTGSILWLGGSAHFFIGNVYVSLMAMTQLGDISLDLPRQNNDPGGHQRWQTDTDRTYDIDLSGYLFDMDMAINLTESLSLTAFCLTASGDRTALDNHFEGIILLMPDILIAPVFFDGLGNPLSTGDELYFPGVKQEGVIAPGIKLGYHPTDAFYIDLSFTCLYPEEKPSSSQDTLGWEADTAVTLEWGPNRSIFAEAGMFVSGNYFQNDSSAPDRVSRIRIGFHMAF